MLRFHRLRLLALPYVACASLAYAQLEGDVSDAMEVSVTASPQQRQLNVGVVENMPGFSTVGTFGAYRGFDVEIAQELCERINARCSITALPLDEIFSALDERRINIAVAAVAPQANTDSEFIYTIPYVELAQRFVVPGEFQKEPSPTVGIVRAALEGTAQAEHLMANSGPLDTVALYSNLDGMWIDLAMKRVDAALALAHPARYEFLATPLGEGFRLSSYALGMESGPALAATIAMRQSESELRDDLNAAIETLVSTQEYDQILNRHLGNSFAHSPFRGSRDQKP